MIRIAKGDVIHAVGIGKCQIAGVRQTGHTMTHDTERGFIIKRVYTVYMTSDVPTFAFMTVELEEQTRFEIVEDL